MPDGIVNWRPWAPQPGPQLAAIDAAWCDELLFGGARGGGKSDFLLGDFGADVPTYGEDWRGILFRKTYPELEEIIARSKQIYPASFPGAEFLESSKTWNFPGGATLRMRYLERDAHAGNYQGHQYTWLGFDELGNWASATVYKMLLACLRNGNRPVERKRVRSSANPGGPGHQWVKSRFIDPAPMGYKPIRDEQTGMVRMFVPSLVTDNLMLMANDPKYVDRLRGVGSAELVRAWLEGDWSVIAGAYFDCWDTAKHVIKPFAIPAHWLRFTAMDWGSAAPFCVQWWAVSDGMILPDGTQYPTGALICYREWYGASEPNVGIKLTAEQLADGIVQREAREARLPDGKSAIAYRVADPSCWKVDGGPSIAERMARRDVIMRPADNSRINGWDQLRDRLIGEDDVPMIHWFETCVDSIRTIPALQHDTARPEDIDSSAEDHCGDTARYSAMSRPFTRRKPKPPNPLEGMPENWKAHFERERRKRDED
jgi:hypothetical protein